MKMEDKSYVNIRRRWLTRRLYSDRWRWDGRQVIFPVYGLITWWRWKMRVTYMIGELDLWEDMVRDCTLVSHELRKWSGKANEIAMSWVICKEMACVMLQQDTSLNWHERLTSTKLL
jgi:hypothetical protein